MTARAQSLTVLVVDDEPEIPELMAFAFERVGATVLQAYDGRTAFEMVCKHKVDAVVTDIRMPKGSGIDLLEKIQSRPAPRPLVYMMTGYSDISVGDAIAKGAEGLFSKPFDLDMIVETVVARWKKAAA